MLGSDSGYLAKYGMELDPQVGAGACGLLVGGRVCVARVCAQQEGKPEDGVVRRTLLHVLAISLIGGPHCGTCTAPTP